MSSDASSGSFKADSPAPPETSSPQAKRKAIVDVLTGRASDAPPDEGGAERRPVDTGPPPASDRPALEFDDDDGDELSAAEERREQAKALRDFAKEHGITVKQAMGMLVDFPGEDEEPVSIGQLKDRWRESRQFEQQRDEFEEYHDKAQAVIMASQRQMQDVISRVANVVRPEVMARILHDVGADDQASLEKNRAQMLEMFPEWRDVQHLTAARDKMVSGLATYGFKREEVGQIRDARVVKFIVDALKLRDRYERLKTGGTREVKPSVEPPSRKGHRPSIDDRAKALADRGDKTAAVALLLKGDRK